MRATVDPCARKVDAPARVAIAASETAIRVSAVRRKGALSPDIILSRLRRRNRDLLDELVHVFHSIVERLHHDPLVAAVRALVIDVDRDPAHTVGRDAVSYTHLTLPTNRE